MQLISTRGGPGAGTWSFRDALFLGQAPDDGLFVPATLPPLPDPDRTALPNLTFPERAFIAARHLLGGEIPHDVLRAAIHDALDFSVPLHEIEPGIHLLELFHGPTHAFKDVGARFMARMMSALRDSDAPPLTILVATSGDTGGAVAHAFHNLPGIRVVVLYPLGKVTVPARKPSSRPWAATSPPWPSAAPSTTASDSSAEPSPTRTSTPDCRSLPPTPSTSAASSPRPSITCTHGPSCRRRLRTPSWSFRSLRETSATSRPA